MTHLNVAQHARQTIPRLCTGAVALAVIGAGVFAHQSAEAYGRDADGSRMQARHVNLNSTARDTLMPPKDRVDWRAFKVTSVRSISMSAQHKPASAQLNLRLVNSRGQQVGSASSRGGATSMSQMLKPGVYYLATSSNARVSYRLSIR